MPTYVTSDAPTGTSHGLASLRGDVEVSLERYG